MGLISLITWLKLKIYSLFKFMYKSNVDKWEEINNKLVLNFMFYYSKYLNRKTKHKAYDPIDGWKIKGDD